MKSNQRKFLLLSLLTVFLLTIFVRFSIVFDLLGKWLGIDLFTRLITRLPWLLSMVVLIVAVAIVGVMVMQYGRKVWLNKKNKNEEGVVSIVKLVKEKVIVTINSNRMVFLITVGILVSAFLSLVFTAEKEQPFYGMLYYMFIVAEFWLIVVLWGKDIAKVWRRINYVLIIVLLVVAIVQVLAFANGGKDNQIVAFFDSFGGFIPISYFTLANGSLVFLRPSSLMADPNFLGIFASVVLLLAADDVLMNIKKRKINWFALVGFLSSIVLILLTNSRTAFVMVVVGILVYLLGLFVKKIIARRVKLKRTQVTPALSIIWIDSLFNRVKDALTLADGSTQEHLRFGRAAIIIFEAYPIFGIGIGNYPIYYQTMIDSTLIFATPHSAYLKVLSELGLVGTVMMVLLILYFLQLIIRSKNVVLLAIFVAILVGNLFYDFFMTPWVWFYMGVIYCKAKEEITNIKFQVSNYKC